MNKSVRCPRPRHCTPATFASDHIPDWRWGWERRRPVESPWSAGCRWRRCRRLGRGPGSPAVRCLEGRPGLAKTTASAARWCAALSDGNESTAATWSAAPPRPTSASGATGDRRTSVWGPQLVAGGPQSADNWGPFLLPFRRELTISRNLRIKKP